MAINVAKEVRAAYEQVPYPTITKDTLRRPPMRVPPFEWISSVVPPAWYPPRRILVAGCGTGVEAFALGKRFPKAEIVGVDFAARSIRIAQRLQDRAKRTRAIRFLHADLTDPGLTRVTGGDFDFISCHGVMSYLPAPARALRNLVRCLTPEGVFYLGVNGQAHFSENWRKFLCAFGFDLRRWPGGRRLWQHLKFSAALAGPERVEVLKHGVAYLASDLFGPLIHNLPLTEWARICRQAGLHLRGSHGVQRLLWPAINDGSHELFLPRGRGEIAQLLDVLTPGGFHRLILTRQPETMPPWKKPTALIDWRPVRTDQLRKFKWPARRSARLLRLTNKAANISLELRGAGWEIALLRGSDGKRSLREILAPLAPVAPAALRSQLYLFYLLDLLNFLPPATRPVGRKPRRAASRQRRRSVRPSGRRARA